MEPQPAHQGAHRSPIADIARRQHALVTLAQLDDLGVTRRQRQWRLATGRWESPYTGVYRIGGLPHSWRSDLLAACLAGPAVASHRSAAALWDLPGARATIIVEIITAALGAGSSMRGLVVHEIAVARATATGRRRRDTDHDDRADDLRPVQLCLRAWSSTWRSTAHSDVSSSITDARSRPSSRLANARARGAAMFHRDHGSAIGRRAYPGERSGTAARSQRLVDQGLPEPEVQYVVVDTDGRLRGSLRSCLPAVAVVIEYDSVQEHTGRAALLRRQRTPERDHRAGLHPGHCDRRRSAQSRRPASASVIRQIRDAPPRTHVQRIRHTGCA